MPAWMTRGGLLVPIGSTPAPPASFDVTLNVGDNFQTVVNANPAGTSYFIASGTHRQQQVVPKNGDSFTGPGDLSAVMNGSKVLDPAAFVYDSTNTRWYIGGQTQEGFSPQATQTEAGWANDYRVEEVFVNGSTRLRHAETLGGLVSGKFYFDYTADRIYIKDNPASFSLIETSVTPFALGGAAVDGVNVQYLTVEKYANAWQYGAIGGDQTNKGPRNWIISDVVARLTHAIGIHLGPGCKLRYSRATENGQQGLGGNGELNGYSARCEVSNTEVDNNRVLGVNPGWQGGASKFTKMRGFDCFNNWVHHNRGYGLWMDIDNRDCQIHSNLSHHNDAHGIFFEVSGDNPPATPTNIYWNEVHDNSQTLQGTTPYAGIDIANSRNVNVYENLGYNEYRPVQLRMNESRWEGTIGTDFGYLENVQVYRNDFQATDKIMLYCNDFESQAEADVWAYNKGNGFHDNTHRVPSLTGGHFRWGNIAFQNLTAAQWQAISAHSNETVIASSVKGTLPAGAVPFDPAAVGPR